MNCPICQKDLERDSKSNFTLSHYNKIYDWYCSRGPHCRISLNDNNNCVYYKVFFKDTMVGDKVKNIITFDNIYISNWLPINSTDLSKELIDLYNRLLKMKYYF